MRVILAIVVGVLVAACDLHITNPAPVVTATPSTPGITVTNTNTNTSTNNNDRSDTSAPTAPTTPGDTTPGQALPLPSYGETVTRGVAASNPALLANSCQDTSGESAWGFLDTVIRNLRSQASDLRWGYLCKDAACTVFARDVVAYRATAAETGIWIVDVIGGHCPGPGDGAPAVRWGVLPFETVRKWAASR